MGSSPTKSVYPGDTPAPAYGEVDNDAAGPSAPIDDEGNEDPSSTVKFTGMLQGLVDELQCSICMEVMNSDSIRPKQLICGHTLCQVCVEMSISGDGLDCPHCRRRTKCRRVQDIPDNQTLKGVADRVKQIEQQLTASTSEADGTFLCQCSKGKASERCKKCCELMCTDCALYTRCSNNAEGRHDTVKLDVIVKDIRRKLTARYTSGLMEMSKLVELLYHADILKKSSNIKRLLEEGDKIAERLDCTAVLSDQPPRSRTQTTLTPLPLIDGPMLERTKTLMGGLGAEVDVTFNTAECVSSWRIDDASCVLALIVGRKQRTIITSNEKSKGMLSFNAAGQAEDTFFPQIGSFRGICSMNQLIYVISSGTSDVRASSDSSQFIQVFSEGGNKINQFNLPKDVLYASGISASAGKIYVADADSGRIYIVSSETGQILTYISHTDLKCPYGVAVFRNSILVADNKGHQVLSFTENGQLNWSYGSVGTAVRGKLNKPLGIACDDQGQVYVADWGNSRVTLLSPKGDYKTDILTSQQVNCPMTLSVHKDMLVVKQENRLIKTFQLKH